MEVSLQKNEFSIFHKGEEILRFSEAEPMLYVGCGKEDVEMYRGNFKIEDYVTERYPLKIKEIRQMDDGCEVNFGDEILAHFVCSQQVCTVNFKSLNENINRFWIRIPAQKEEKCYGCGAQMSYFNMRGRHFPLWSSEPGVGRDKTTYVTWRSDVENKAGGDYYNTNYPQTTYLSTKKYFLHMDTTAYADFDFRHENYHELQGWEVPKQIRIECADNYIELAKCIGDYFGKQPELPEWLYDGVIIGVQGGTEKSFSLAEDSLKHGIKLAGIWCQDWEGKRETSFGKRLQWNWKWDEKMYPQLPQKMKEYRDKGIGFLGYINPYLVNDGEQYQEGKKKGYFATKMNGEDYLVDFGEFYCGVVDFTNPAAYEWFKEIIKKNLIEFGLDGWMADFGEYLPIDVKLYDGSDPMKEHNYWPVLWARCNYEALEETGNIGKKIFFMRSGAAGSQKYCPLYWPGDQSVDFSIHDGLASVMVGALSAGVTGNGLYHCDIGGYTSLFDNVRTKEVFLRWAEMAVFMPVMRTHEGNRPDTNFQYYEDADTMKKFARLVTIHVALKPYIKSLVEENAEDGIPVMRPMFYHYSEEACYEIQTQYLLGRDLLAAPVYTGGAKEREVYLPKDQWVHLFTGEEYEGGTETIAAPMGCPPVFYRKNSPFAALFEEIGKQETQRRADYES